MFGTKVLEERKSKYNGNLRVVRSIGLGTYIQADGLTQSGGVVESMWKQTIKKVKGKRSKVKECLILGLGGGTLVKIINKYFPEAKITGVDIDSLIVELGQKYLKSDFSNVNVKITDALDFTKLQSQTSNRYDLIVVDLYNGDKFPKKFESNQFLKVVGKLISKDGKAVFNRLYYKNKTVEAENFKIKLQKVFKNVESYRPLTNIMFLCS